MRDDHKAWIRETFDRAAPTYGGSASPFFDYFGKRLVELARVGGGTNALDIATGTGAILLPLSRSASKVVGIDISDEMVRQAKLRVPTAHCQQMDAEHLDFDEGQFDYIFCGFALFFLPSPKKALEEMYRILKPGGKIAISIWDAMPTLPQWVEAEAKQLGATREWAISDIASNATLEHLLEEAHFSAIRLTREEKTFTWPDANSWWESLWSHAFRAKFEQLSPENLALLKARTIDRCNQMDQIAEHLIAHMAIATKDK